MIHRMSFDDFKRLFTDLDICDITVDQYDASQSGEFFKGLVLS